MNLLHHHGNSCWILNWCACTGNQQRFLWFSSPYHCDISLIYPMASLITLINRLTFSKPVALSCRLSVVFQCQLDGLRQRPVYSYIINKTEYLFINVYPNQIKETRHVHCPLIWLVKAAFNCFYLVMREATCRMTFSIVIAVTIITWDPFIKFQTKKQFDFLNPIVFFSDMRSKASWLHLFLLLQLGKTNYHYELATHIIVLFSSTSWSLLICSFHKFINLKTLGSIKCRTGLSIQTGVLFPAS